MLKNEKRKPVLPLASALMLLLYLSYLRFFPFRVIEIKQQPFLVLEKELRAGDPIEYLVQVCKKMEVPGEVSVILVDSIPRSIDKYRSDIPKGSCAPFIAPASVIPRSVKPGRYKLLIVVKYKVNPLKTIKYEIETEDFKVVE